MPTQQELEQQLNTVISEISTKVQDAASGLTELIARVEVKLGDSGVDLTDELAALQSISAGLGDVSDRISGSFVGDSATPELSSPLEPVKVNPAPAEAFDETIAIPDQTDEVDEF